MSLGDSSNSNGSWISGLGSFIHERSNVEAILIDDKQKRISVATSGPVNEVELKSLLHETIVNIQDKIVNNSVAMREKPEGLHVQDRRDGTLIQRETPTIEPTFWQWRELPWPDMEEVKEHYHEEDWRLLALLSTICGITGLAAYFLQLFGVGPEWLSIGLFVVSMCAGGWDAAHDVLHKLPKGQLDIHFLMLAVAVGAIAIGAWKEGALLLFLFSLSAALEHLAKDRTRRAIDSLFKTAPKNAVVIQDGEEVELPINKVRPGMEIVVKPGQLFPVDAEVLSGESAADESNLTGESTPIQKNPGDPVYSGTMNLWGAVQAKVLRPAKESSLQMIINLIQEAQHLKAPSQRFTDKFGTPYTYAILSLVTLMFFVWWLGFGVSPFINEPESFSAFYRAMTLLVVASPCALVLSIPSAILAAIAWGASNGILFRGGAAIEKLSQVDLVALDKTGTLTTGELTVHAVESFPPGRERDVSELAYSIERKATHPIARAIVAYGKSQKLAKKDIQAFKSLTGQGVQASHGEATCVLGRRALLEMGPLKEWIRDVPQVSEEFSEVWVVYKDLIGRILLKDSIRKESKPVLQKLQALGIKTVMLTGDRRETAQSVAQSLGIQEIQSNLSPEDKVLSIQAFSEQGHKVAMVGDGVNDAPSLAASFVPVAMGARGSDAALEQSEIILMNDRIDNFLEAFQLSRRAEKIIRINLFISLLSIITMVIAGSFGIVPLTLGVITHEGSTVFVCLNSLRLLTKKL